MDILEAMNSNLENRKHGGYSQIGNMQADFLKMFPNVETYNFMNREEYFPESQKFMPGSFDELNKLISQNEMHFNYDAQTEVIEENLGRVR